jgi:hypothetical protein
MPSEEECKTLGIIPGDNPMYPETWLQRYEDKGQMLPPSLEPAPTTSPAALPSYDRHIYICLEDYVSQGPSNSLAMQIHDRYKPTGATGYYIRDCNDSCMDIILAYPVGLEQNVWLLLGNQRQATQQFPESEPNCARTLNLNELHLTQYLANWDILDTYHNSLVLSRQEQRLRYFRQELHNLALLRGWYKTILGARTDGRAVLHETFVHELGISPPNLVPVSPHFMEGPIAHYPRGPQHIVMLHYCFTYLDFFERVESYLEYHKKPELNNGGRPL